MSFLRPAVLALGDVPHGGLNPDEARALGVDPATVVDLSVNTNPLGPSPVVLAAANVDLAHYPSATADPFRRAVAATYGVSIDQVVAGNGAAEIIWLLAMATIEPGRRAAILGPTFGEYARAVQVMGGDVVEVRAEPPDFVPPLEAFRDALPGTRLAFLCHPNNPTGQSLTRDDVRSLVRSAPDTLFVIDEAYLPFSDAESMLPLLPDAPNLVIMRSMTKDAAIPGLRLGYAIASPDVARAMRSVAPPWNVNAAAIAAGIVALAETDWAGRGAAVARREIQTLTAGLRAKGYQPVSTTANFLIVEVRDAAAVRQTLLKAGLLVRSCASFGLPGYLRIAAGAPPAIDRLLDALPPA